MKKAEITVYLALTLTVMLSLILTLVEGARIGAIRMQAECVTDMGLNSAFAEYHRELLSQYDLLFIDTAYGMGVPSLANTENHIKDYMKYNFNPVKGTVMTGVREWLAIEIDDLLISEGAVASDLGGAVCKRQAVRYWKDKAGMQIMDELQTQMQEVKAHNLDNRNMQTEQEKIQNQIEEELLERENENGDWEKVQINNPAAEVLSTRGGILAMVVDGSDTLSVQSVLPQNCLSQRKIASGTGLPKGQEAEEGVTEEILFGEYLMEKCGNYRQQKKDSYLHYQLEYLLEGYFSDMENLKGTANQLLMLREAANTVSIYGDSGKKTEADAAAALIAAAAFVPQIQPLVKHSLLLAWAYAESVRDVKVLFSGGKVPLLKRSQDWNLTLTELPNFKNHLLDGIEKKEGADYSSYLRMLLLLMNREEKSMRFMDLVEMDIRQSEGNAAFRMDGCVDSLTVDIAFSSKFGYHCQIRRFFCYDS